MEPTAHQPINRIDRTLAESPAGLWPFIPAGYPSIEATGEILLRLSELGVRGFEIGFPFSDPIADGPVIQHAFSEAIRAGVRVADVFGLVQRVRPRISQPILGMASASIVYRIGVDEFVNRAAACGFDGLIIPDLSLEEAPDLKSSADDAGLRMVMLVAPTTDLDRRRRIGECATGFLYYVSVQGTTGARDALPADLRETVSSIRHSTGRRVIVGFGVSSREQVESICDFADGAIIGSAIVRRMSESVASGDDVRTLGGKVVQFVAGLI